MRGSGTVVAMAMALSACGNGGGGAQQDAAVDAIAGDGGIDAPADAPPMTSGSRVSLIARGIRTPVVVRLDQSAGPIQRHVVVSQDGTFYFPGRFEAGLAYVLTAADTRCRIVGDPGIVSTTDTTAQLYCHGIVELDSVQLPSSLIITPSFDPEARDYGGKRPLLMDASYPITLTPSVAYPTEAITLTVSDSAATTDQPITVPYGTGIAINVSHPSGVPAATYAFTPRNTVDITFVKATPSLSGMRLSTGSCAVDANGGLAISDDLLAVGAPCNAAGNAEGTVHIFRRTGWTWSVEQKLTGPEIASEFGAALALDGDTLLVGAPSKNGATASTERGAVYVYRRANNTWTLEATLGAPNPGDADRFGASVALTGDVAAVGAPREDSSATNAGAVYLFKRTGTSWGAPVYIKASNTGTDDEFGRAVAMTSTTLVVGAPFEDGSGRTINASSDEMGADAGAAYIFDITATPVQQAYVKASNADTLDGFGSAVAVDGDTVAVGAPGEDSDGTSATNNGASAAGAAYVYVRSGTQWSEQAYVKARLATAPATMLGADGFGSALALSGNQLIVGAPREDGSGTGLDPAENDNAFEAGAVYTYTRAGTTWGTPHYVKATNTGQFDHFGAAVAVDGDTFAAGAPSEDSASTGINGASDENASNAGAVYVFR